MLTPEEKEVLVQLICKEQSEMIVSNHMTYDSEAYINLEALKVKIKRLED